MLIFNHRCDMESVYFQFDRPACNECLVKLCFNEIYSNCDGCGRTYVIYNDLKENEHPVTFKVNHLTHFHFNNKINPIDFGHSCTCQMPDEVKMKWIKMNKMKKESHK